MCYSDLTFSQCSAEDSSYPALELGVTTYPSNVPPLVHFVAGG